jgi:hypothetical protein
MIEPFSKKASSKTLKQLIQEHLLKGATFADDCQEAVKEWLTQKRQERNENNTFDYIQMILIDELLEELKQ